MTVVINRIFVNKLIIAIACGDKEAARINYHKITGDPLNIVFNEVDELLKHKDKVASALKKLVFTAR